MERFSWSDLSDLRGAWTRRMDMMSARPSEPVGRVEEAVGRVDHRVGGRHGTGRVMLVSQVR